MIKVHNSVLMIQLTNSFKLNDFTTETWISVDEYNI